MLNVQFTSLPINMFIEYEHFVKLAASRYYYSMDVKLYQECLTERVEGDVLLCCQHNENCEEAVETWNTRCLRGNCGGHL